MEVCTVKTIEEIAYGLVSPNNKKLTISYLQLQCCSHSVKSDQVWLSFFLSSDLTTILNTNKSEIQKPSNINQHYITNISLFFMKDKHIKHKNRKQKGVATCQNQN